MQMWHLSAHKTDFSFNQGLFCPSNSKLGEIQQSEQTCFGCSLSSQRHLQLSCHPWSKKLYFVWTFINIYDILYRAENTVGLVGAYCFTCLWTETLIRKISFLPVHISKTVTNCCFLVWLQITHKQCRLITG